MMPTAITPRPAQYNSPPVQYVRSLLYPFEPLPPYTPRARDPETVLYRAPSYASAAPSYHTIDPSQAEDDNDDDSEDSDDNSDHDESTHTITVANVDEAAGVISGENDDNEENHIDIHNQDYTTNNVGETPSTQARVSNGSLRPGDGQTASSDSSTASTPRLGASTPTPAVTHELGTALPQQSASTSSTETQEDSSGSDGQNNGPSPDLSSPGDAIRTNSMNESSSTPTTNGEPDTASRPPPVSPYPTEARTVSTERNGHNYSSSLPLSRPFAPSPIPPFQPYSGTPRPSTSPSPRNIHVIQSQSSSQSSGQILPPLTSLTPIYRNEASNPVSVVSRELSGPSPKQPAPSSPAGPAARNENMSPSSSSSLLSPSSSPRMNQYWRPNHSVTNLPTPARRIPQAHNVGRQQVPRQPTPNATNTSAAQSPSRPPSTRAHQRQGKENRPRSRSLRDLLFSAKPKHSKANEAPPRPGSARSVHPRSPNLSRSLMPASRSEMNLSRVPRAASPETSPILALEDSSLVGRTAAERNRSQRLYRTEEAQQSSIYVAVPVDMSSTGPLFGPSDAARNASESSQESQVSHDSQVSQPSQDGEANTRSESAPTPPPPPQRPYRSLVESALRHTPPPGPTRSLVDLTLRHNGPRRTESSIERRRPAPLPIRKHTSHVHHGHGGGQNRNSMTGSMRNRAAHSSYAAPAPAGQRPYRSLVESALRYTPPERPYQSFIDSALRDRPRQGPYPSLIDLALRHSGPRNNENFIDWRRSTSLSIRKRTSLSRGHGGPNRISMAGSNRGRTIQSPFINSNARNGPSNRKTSAFFSELASSNAEASPTPTTSTTPTPLQTKPTTEGIGSGLTTGSSPPLRTPCSSRTRQRVVSAPPSSIPQQLLASATSFRPALQQTDVTSQQQQKHKQRSLSLSSVPKTRQYDLFLPSRQPYLSSSLASPTPFPRRPSRSSSPIFQPRFQHLSNVADRLVSSDTSTDAARTTHSEPVAKLPDRQEPPINPPRSMLYSSSTGDGDGNGDNKSNNNDNQEDDGYSDKNRSASLDNRAEATPTLESSSSSSKSPSLEPDATINEPPHPRAQDPSTPRSQSVSGSNTGERAGEAPRSSPRSMIHDVMMKENSNKASNNNNDDNNNNNNTGNATRNSSSSASGSGESSPKGTANPGRQSSSIRTPLRPDASARRHLRETRATQLMRLQLAGLDERDKQRRQAGANRSMDQKLPTNVMNVGKSPNLNQSQNHLQSRNPQYQTQNQNQRLVAYGEESQTRPTARIKEKFRLLGRQSRAA